MFRKIFDSLKKPTLYFAPSYAVIVCSYPNVVWWTWLIFIGLLGVYACLLAIWVSVMALDEIQLNWKMFQSNRRKHSNSCSEKECKIKS